MGDAIGYHWQISQRGISRPSQISREVGSRAYKVRQSHFLREGRDTNRAPSRRKSASYVVSALSTFRLPSGSPGGGVRGPCGEISVSAKSSGRHGALRHDALPTGRRRRFSERGGRVVVPETVETPRCRGDAKPISTRPVCYRSGISAHKFASGTAVP